MIVGKVKQKPDFARVLKNYNFGIAVGLTQTAKDAQKAVKGTAASTFTIRNNWLEQSNKFGIKIKPATKTKLQAEISTLANWLDLHETGGDKLPRKRFIAIPSANVRRNKKDIITKGNRPQALRSKNTFVIDTKNGPVIFQRKGKGKRAKIIALYYLEPKVRIKKQSTFYAPIQKTIDKKLMVNIRKGIRTAFATAK